MITVTVTIHAAVLMLLLIVLIHFHQQCVVSVMTKLIYVYSLFACCLVHNSRLRTGEGHIITKTSKFKPDLNYILEAFYYACTGRIKSRKNIAVLLFGISSCSCQLPNRQSSNKFRSISCL